MALEVRRIVTGHDSQGKAVVATDERLSGTGAAGRMVLSMRASGLGTLAARCWEVNHDRGPTARH